MAEQRATDLVAYAKADGVFVVPLYEDMTDRYYREGDLLAYVIGPGDQLVRVVVPQDAIDRVRVNTDRIRLRFVDHPDTPVSGHIIRAVPGGDETLPSRALAVEGGGEIATDPRDNRSVKALRRMFQFDVGTDGARGRPAEFGQRVYVRFEHERGSRCPAQGGIGPFGPCCSCRGSAERPDRRCQCSGALILADIEMNSAPGRPYPERAEHRPGPHDRFAEMLMANVVRPLRRMVHDPATSLRPIVERTLSSRHGHAAGKRCCPDCAGCGDAGPVAARRLHRAADRRMFRTGAGSRGTRARLPPFRVLN